MEVSTHLSNSFGRYSDHQGVSYEEEDVFSGFEKSAFVVDAFGSANNYVTSLQKGGSLMDDDDEAMSCEDQGSSSWADVEMSNAEESSISSSEHDVFSLSSDGENLNSGVSLYTSSTEMLRIRFPFLSISVRLADFLCLQEKELVNDTIVDFYLNHIVQHLLPDDPNMRITVLPALFWHNLSIRQVALPDEFDQMPSHRQEDARFADVLEYLNDFELFDVDYLLVPVNEWDQWSLLVVCHPWTPRSKIICFDSQLNADASYIRHCADILQAFLAYACSHGPCEAPKAFYPPDVVVPCNLPQQIFPHDSAVYMLEFARRFFLDPPHKIENLDFGQTYPNFNIIGRRREVQNVILSLTSNRKMFAPLLELLDRNAARFPRA